MRNHQAWEISTRAMPTSPAMPKQRNAARLTVAMSSGRSPTTSTSSGLTTTRKVVAAGSAAQIDQLVADPPEAVVLSAVAAQQTGEGVDRLSSIENLVTGAGNDGLTGSAAANVLVAGAGAEAAAVEGSEWLALDDIRKGAVPPATGSVSASPTSPSSTPT